MLMVLSSCSGAKGDGDVVGPMSFGGQVKDRCQILPISFQCKCYAAHSVGCIGLTSDVGCCVVSKIKNVKEKQGVGS